MKEQRYEIAPDIGLGEENPVFYCEDLNELISMMKFFFRSGYDVFTRETEE